MSNETNVNEMIPQTVDKEKNENTSQIVFPIVVKGKKRAEFAFNPDNEGLRAVSTANEDEWRKLYEDEDTGDSSSASSLFWQNKKLKYILICDDDGSGSVRRALIMRDGVDENGETGNDGSFYTLYNNTTQNSKEIQIQKGRGRTSKTITNSGGINRKGFGTELSTLLKSWDQGLLSNTENVLTKQAASPGAPYKAVLTLAQKSNKRLEIIFYLEDEGKGGAADDLTVRMCDLIKHKKHQIIFHGAPGTGKTFTAQQLAKSFVWGKTQLDSDATLGKLNRLYDYYKGLTDFQNLTGDAAKMHKTLKPIITRLLRDQTPYVDEDELFKAYFCVNEENNAPDADAQDGEENKIPEKAAEEIAAKTDTWLKAYYTDNAAENRDEEQTSAGKGNNNSPNAVSYGINDLKKDLWDMQGRMELIQFHPSYDYTDFVEGLRPVEDDNDRSEKNDVHFHRVDGCFMHFCRFVTWRNRLAENNPQETGLPKYFFIIDEINRADLSKVLGELMYAMESDKRDTPIPTQYDNLTTWFPPEERKKELSLFRTCFKDGFMIPSNVVIIGTMNDIDRSVESMDFAMRRRFIWEQIRVTKESLQQAFLYGRFFRDVFGKDLEDTEKNACKAIAKAVYNFNQKWLNEQAQEEKTLTRILPEFASGDYDIAQGLFTDIKKEDLGIRTVTARSAAQKIMEYAWRYRVGSLLREYFRGNAKAEAQFLRLKGAWDQEKDSISTSEDETEALWNVLYKGKSYNSQAPEGMACKEISARMQAFNKELIGTGATVAPDTFAYLPESVLRNEHALLDYVWEHRIEWPLLQALKKKKTEADVSMDEWKKKFVPEDPAAQPLQS